MLKKFSLFLIVGFLLLGQSVSANPSLWLSAAGTPPKSLFADHRASAVGDTLTILISESSSASTSKSMTNGKSGSTSLGAGAGIFHFLAAASANQSDSFKAKGASVDSNSVNGRITVTVVSVEPNGNLVVEGSQSIWQNKDEHHILFRGVVRPEDISYNNTVPSSLVADATVRFDGKGPLNAKQRQGILTQILNILF